jgi:hypothetical protein
LCICCHFSQYGLSILENSLNFLLSPLVTHCIICYSKSIDIDLEQIKLTNCEVIFLEDETNKYMDIGKFEMIYNYIRNNNIDFNRILILNDSVIICCCLKYIVDDIINDNLYEFIGILETYQQIRHAQSWWLNFN